MTHPLNDTCPACRAAAQLGLTDPNKIDLLHSAGQHLIDYYVIRHRSEDLGFNVMTDEITLVLSDHIFNEAPAPTHH